MTEKELLDFWQNRKPPDRPSQHMLHIYENAAIHLGMDKSGTWGIMGCTPELRTLAGKYKRPLTCIDMNPLAFGAFRPLCQPPADEKFIQSDWLGTDLPEAFDLIFCDGSLIMLPQEKHQGFLDSIHRMLKPGGYAILKVLSVSGWEFDSTTAILDWFRDNHQDKMKMDSLCTHLAIQWMDRKAMAISTSDYTAERQKLGQSNLVTPKEYQELLMYEQNVDLQATSHERITEMLADSFDILSVENPSDFLGGAYNPIYTICKRQSK